MKHKLIQTISIVLTAAFMWQTALFAAPDEFYSLRPRALEERKPIIPPDVLEKVLLLQTTGERLITLRRYLGWTQRELEHRSGVTDTAVWYIETNNTIKPRRETLSKLAAAIGIDEDVLYPEITKEIPGDTLEYVAQLSALQEKLVYLLNVRGMSGGDLVVRSGISKRQIWAILNGKIEKQPRIETIRRLARALVVNEELLIGYQSTPAPALIMEDILAMPIGERLRYLRSKYRRMSAPRLSELSGISEDYITKIERGKVTSAL